MSLRFAGDREELRLIPLVMTDERLRASRWPEMLKTHDSELYQHSVLVRNLPASFSAHLGFSEADQQRLAAAGFLHDVGKLRIDRSTLNKPGRLTNTETLQMRLHPGVGHKMLVANGL